MLSLLCSGCYFLILFVAVFWFSNIGFENNQDSKIYWELESVLLEIEAGENGSRYVAGRFESREKGTGTNVVVAKFDDELDIDWFKTIYVGRYDDVSNLLFDGSRLFVLHSGSSRGGYERGCI